MAPLTFNAPSNTFNDTLFTFDGNPNSVRARIICIKCQEYNSLKTVISEVIGMQVVDKTPVIMQFKIGESMIMQFKIEEYIPERIHIEE